MTQEQQLSEHSFEKEQEKAKSFSTGIMKPQRLVREEFLEFESDIKIAAKDQL